MAESCKTSLCGEPKCKLGSLTNYVQIYGLRANLCPSMKADAPTKTKLMIIAKSPDMKDKVTIGNGRNIDKLKDLLAMATISTEDVYVTGMVKCAPPKRPASVQEQRACMVHLADELKAVDPDVVVLMGAGALRAFNLMGEGGVNALHGKHIKKAFPHDDTMQQEYNIVVTTDPNALYMNPDPRLESTIVKDLRVAKSLVEGKLINPKEEKCEYKLIENSVDLDWMIDSIKKKGMFAFDTESRMLPWSTQPLICAQFSWGYKEGTRSTAVLPFYNHDPEGTDWLLKPTWSTEQRAGVVERLRTIFEDSSIPKVGHNIKYDMLVMRKHCGLETKGFLFDTMLMHHLLWEHPPHDLEYLSDLELDTGDYSKALKQITGRGKELKNPYDHVPDHMMWEYGSKDAECTYRLFCKYYPRLKANAKLWELYQKETHPTIRTLMKAEWYGVRLNPDVIDTLTEEFTEDKDKLLIEIKRQTWPEFNPDTPADVAKAITNAGYFKDIEDKKRAKGWSTQKSKLLALAPKFPLVNDIMKFRSLSKLVGNYMKNAKELTKSDGRARISVMIHGTVNGRVACAFLHQIPRLNHKRIAEGKGNLRDMFIAAPGYKIVYGDFSMIELMVLAILANDTNMLEIFRKGGDIHKATASAFLESVWPGITDALVNEHNRSLAKPVNFSRVYGAVEGEALMKETWMDKAGNEFAVTYQMVRDGYASLDSRFPQVANYFENTVAEISASAGTHVTPFGRIKHMGSTLVSGNKWARANAERQAVNGTVQSPANSVTLRTLNAVDDAFTEKIQAGEMEEEDGLLAVTVHDSGVWEIKEELVDWFVPTLREIAALPVNELGGFEFKMKVGVGNSWTEAELNAK
jgi:DNA polymerase-1